jgi:long-chain acyl-CoA synthetase
MVSVPRLFEKIYARVMDTILSGSFLKKKIFYWALGVGRECGARRLGGRPVTPSLERRLRLAHKLVFSKILEKTGGRVRFFVSGGAPLAKDIAEFFHALGLVVLEGYGLTETSPVIAVNTFDNLRFGTVGKPIPGVDVKIAEDGEIIVRGPNVMKGYYNKPEATREVFDGDGWFRTGDIGYIDPDGFLFITDRKKELLKTAGGKYVAPQPIENRLKVHTLIEQAVVIGDKRKYCVALIVPTFEALEATLGRPLPADKNELNGDPQVRSLFQAAVDEVNRDLGSWEQIKRFHLLPAELTQDTGELTPSLKVKRRVVDDKYKTVIDAMYPPD